FSTVTVLRPASSVIMTGFFAPASNAASSSMAPGSAMGAGIGTFSADAFLVILSKRYSIGIETKTGPLGEPIANWQARWMVEGNKDFALTPWLHFTQRSTSRPGPPI